MGAWEVGNFGNDDAMDFVSEVAEAGKNVLLTAIQKIASLPADKYAESPDCCVALAAIEFIAAKKGNPSTDIPDEATEWIETNDFLPFKTKGILGIGAKEIDIISLSMSAIKRIKSDSELRELWQESDEYEKWVEVITDLKRRIAE